MLIACHECQKPVSTEAVACPSCGAKVRKTVQGKTITPEQNAVIAAVVIIAGAAFVNYGYNRDAEPRLSIPTDPNATFYILDKGTKNGLPTITTRREGPSGESYSTWEFDCGRGFGRYIGHGDTLEEMKKSRFDPAMYEMQEGSISWYAMKEACGT